MTFRTLLKFHFFLQKARKLVSVHNLHPGNQHLDKRNYRRLTVKKKKQRKPVTILERRCITILPFCDGI